MPEYVVYGSMVVGVYKVVKADSAEAAKEIARNLSPPSLCHQCNSGSDDDDAWGLSDGLSCEGVQEDPITDFEIHVEERE